MKHTTYITVETDDGRYKLSALVEDDGSYHCPSLEVPKEVDEDNYWDNSVYILGAVLPHLKGKCFLPELLVIPKKDHKELKSVIKQGIKMGFFKHE